MMNIDRRLFLSAAPALLLSLFSSNALSYEVTPYRLQHKRSENAPRRSRPSLSKSTSLDDRVVKLFSKIDSQRLMTTIRELQTFSTRNSLSTTVEEVAIWLSKKFRDLEMHPDALQEQPFQMPNGPMRKNLLHRIGLSRQRFILICAHYDSRAQFIGQAAPGADDNASGIAMLLELAWIFREVDLRA